MDQKLVVVQHLHGSGCCLCHGKIPLDELNLSLFPLNSSIMDGNDSSADLYLATLQKELDQMLNDLNVHRGITP
jgi:hypothetical protein